MSSLFITVLRATNEEKGDLDMKHSNLLRTKETRFTLT